jgi:hypothetical protein
MNIFFLSVPCESAPLRPKIKSHFCNFRRRLFAGGFCFDSEVNCGWSWRGQPQPKDHRGEAILFAVKTTVLATGDKITLVFQISHPTSCILGVLTPD